jgi:hypothetical protein
VAVEPFRRRWYISFVIPRTEYADRRLGWLRCPRPGALKFDEFDQFCAHAFLNARLQARPARPTPPKADRGGTLRELSGAPPAADAGQGGPGQAVPKVRRRRRRLHLAGGGPSSAD